MTQEKTVIVITVVIVKRSRGLSTEAMKSVDKDTGDDF